MIITAHTLVKNEARFIWYSVMSVLPFVDRVRLWDTGSTDGTLEIIEEIKKHPLAKGKIFFEKRTIIPFDEQLARQLMLDEHNKVVESFEDVRQDMLDATSADWFIMVDADEIWWDSSIKQLISFVRKEGHKYESVVVPTINMVGDMYHYQERKAGRYRLAGRVGHYNLRAINRRLPGLKSLGAHGVWGWADGDNKMIQDRDPKKIKFIDAPYLHATHLQRAGTRDADLRVLKRGFKRKFEIGIPFPRDYYYPEVFFRSKPDIVLDPWEPMNTSFKYRAVIETPLRKIHRRILPAKVGY